MIGPTLEQPIYNNLRYLSTAVAEAEAGEAEAEPLVEFLAMEDAPDPEDLPPPPPAVSCLTTACSR